MQPRLIRLRDAPHYLGMDRNRFNNEVRPYLINIRIGQQGIAFDRIDLDQWADHYKKMKGNPAKRREQWDKNDSQDLSKEDPYGTLIRKSRGDEFQKALDQALSKKLNIT